VRTIYQELTIKEYEIMKIIWSEQGVTFSEIHDYASSLRKNLSRQSINGYIQNLSNKGFIRSEGEDRHKIYYPAISKADYDKFLSNNILNQLFDGSIKKFVAALSGEDKLTEQTTKELRQILKRKGVDNK